MGLPAYLNEVFWNDPNPLAGIDRELLIVGFMNQIRLGVPPSEKTDFDVVRWAIAATRRGRLVTDAKRRETLAGTICRNERLGCVFGGAFSAKHGIRPLFHRKDSLAPEARNPVRINTVAYVAGGGARDEHLMLHKGSAVQGFLADGLHAAVKKRIEKSEHLMMWRRYRNLLGGWEFELPKKVRWQGRSLPVRIAGVEYRQRDRLPTVATRTLREIEEAGRRR